MVTVILISFEYKDPTKNEPKNNSQFGKLEGSLFDIYTAYMHFTDLGYEIYTMTDIIENYISLRTIRENDPKMKDFLQYLSDKTFVKNISLDNFQNSLKNILCKGDDKYIIYYSGHGINGNILLPNDDKLPMSDFLKIISMYTKPNTQIFIILDCCDVTNLFLPFEFKNNKFKYSEESNLFEQIIMLISSSRGNEKSISTFEGSIFTKFFFEKKETFNINKCIQSLTDEISRDIQNIIKEGNLSNNCQIPNISLYTSYITFPIIWPWVFEKCVEFIPDYTLSYLYSLKNV